MSPQIKFVLENSSARKHARIALWAAPEQSRVSKTADITPAPVRKQKRQAERSSATHQIATLCPDTRCFLALPPGQPAKNNSHQLNGHPRDNHLACGGKQFLWRQQEHWKQRTECRTDREHQRVGQRDPNGTDTCLQQH